jgi:hypothetical protein
MSPRIANFGKSLPTWLKILVVALFTLFVLYIFVGELRLGEWWMHISPLPIDAHEIRTLEDFERSTFCKDIRCVRDMTRSKSGSTVTYVYTTALSPDITVLATANPCSLLSLSIDLQYVESLTPGIKGRGLDSLLKAIFAPGFAAPRRRLIANLLKELNPEGNVKQAIDEIRSDYSLAPIPAHLEPLETAKKRMWGEYVYWMAVSDPDISLVPLPLRTLMIQRVPDSVPCASSSS